MKKNHRIWIHTLLISSSVYLLNILQGSKITIDSSECFIITISFGIGAICLLALIIGNISWKKIDRKANTIILAILVSSVITELIEPYIFDQQLLITNKNLTLTCNAITEFKLKEGKLPDNLSSLEDYETLGTGFKIFNNDFEYVKTGEEDFNLIYSVKYGYSCEAPNCSTYPYYTCVVCGTVENDILGE